MVDMGSSVAAGAFPGIGDLPYPPPPSSTVAAPMGRRVIFAATLALALPAQAAAAPRVRTALPPGANGLSNVLELGAFLSTGARPAHTDDQLALYSGLLRAPRPFTDATLD